MSALVVVSMTLLGVIVGFALGVRLTARRYRRTLKLQHTHLIDLTGAKVRE